MILKFSSIIILLFQILFVTAQDATKNIYDNIVADVPQLLALGVVLNTVPNFVKTLSSEGPFTFFAPSNPAMETINATPDEIGNLLNYHLVQGKFLSADFPNVMYPKTMLKIPTATGKGEPIVVQKVPGGNSQIRSGWKSASILVLDQVASNGVIHIVDSILRPPMTPIQTLSQDPKFVSMVKFLNTPEFGNLAKEIAAVNTAGVTILALTNDVLAKTPKEIAKAAYAKAVFSYHIIPKEIVYTGNVKTVYSATSLGGEGITFTRDDSGLYVGNVNAKAKIIAADIITYMGVIQVIDNILIPLSVPIKAADGPDGPDGPPPSSPEDPTTPKDTPDTTTSPNPSTTTTKPSVNVGIIVAAAIGGVVGGGLIILAVFFLVYKRYVKKPETQQELFPYYVDLGHDNHYSRQTSHYSNTYSNDSYYPNTINSNDNSSDNYYTNNRQPSQYSNTTSVDNYSIPTVYNSGGGGSNQ